MYVQVSTPTVWATCTHHTRTATHASPHVSAEGAQPFPLRGPGLRQLPTPGLPQGCRHWDLSTPPEANLADVSFRKWAAEGPSTSPGPIQATFHLT